MFGLLPDGQLLERFVADPGESGECAFETLLERHGPMVLGVCRARLQDEHAAHDAFQSTFLTLLRNARTLWVQESIGPWLHRVACRTAMKSQATETRRQRHERQAGEMIATHRQGADEATDLRRSVHDEIERLSARHRLPLILCDLEGKTHEEAARILRCPVGTVKSRLARGREHLRTRLRRRGFGSGTGLNLVLPLPALTARVEVPTILIRRTTDLAGEALSRAAASGVFSGLSQMLPSLVLPGVLGKLAVVVGILACLAGPLFGTGQGTESRHASGGKDTEFGRTLTLKVVDADLKPIQNARIFQNYARTTSDPERKQTITRIENVTQFTDASGLTKLKLADTPKDLRIWVSKPGFVSLHAMWAKEFQSDGDQIPEQFTFQLTRGTKIGGVVVDERGDPIPGVKIEVRDQTAFRFHLADGKPGRRPVRSYSLADGDDAVVTDSAGRWVLDNIPSDENLVFEVTDQDIPRFGPANPRHEIEVRLTHPDLDPASQEWGRLQSEQGITLRALRDQVARLVITRKKTK
ncbi:sigma-70 family RNA polymerase sigma factor [Singulisphaera sp. PoT]|uniref:sigma-70 family RNA polymerase sigma factor n=1 Tax=Singulisphaera sp. PoT TaxID=3411797 RepID=UPI003BF5EE31